MIDVAGNYKYDECNIIIGNMVGSDTYVALYEALEEQEHGKRNMCGACARLEASGAVGSHSAGRCVGVAVGAVTGLPAGIGTVLAALVALDQIIDRQ